MMMMKFSSPWRASGIPQCLLCTHRTSRDDMVDALAAADAWLFCSILLAPQTQTQEKEEDEVDVGSDLTRCCCWTV